MKRAAKRGELSFRISRFDELSLTELYNMLHLRDLVFVVGQKVTAEPEVDGRDPECEHIQVFEEGQLIATGRLFVDAHPIMVGRIAVHPEKQRGGYGSWMMARINERLGTRASEMHAQAHLEGWYTRCGWERFGDEFVEAEILHVPMRFPPTN